MSGCQIFHRMAAATIPIGLIASAIPALALEGKPQGHKAKERHVFWNVQLCLSHPSTHEKST